MVWASQPTVQHRPKCGRTGNSNCRRKLCLSHQKSAWRNACSKMPDSSLQGMTTMAKALTNGGAKQLKFAAGIGIILTALAWLAYGGIQETKTYYVTVPELQASRDGHQRRYRVAGTVVAGSIRRTVHRVEFQLQEA